MGLPEAARGRDARRCLARRQAKARDGAVGLRGSWDANNSMIPGCKFGQATTRRRTKGVPRRVLPVPGGPHSSTPGSRPCRQHNRTTGAGAHTERVAGVYNAQDSQEGGTHSPGRLSLQRLPRLQPLLTSRYVPEGTRAPTLEYRSGCFMMSTTSMTCHASRQSEKRKKKKERAAEASARQATNPQHRRQRRAAQKRPELRSYLGFFSGFLSGTRRRATRAEGHVTCAFDSSIPAMSSKERDVSSCELSVCSRARWRPLSKRSR